MDLLHCKLCDYKAKQLHQHLKSEHGLNAESYRSKFGSDQIMQIGFKANSPYRTSKNRHMSQYIKLGYKKIQKQILESEIYNRLELYDILTYNDLWKQYLGKTKYRTMINDDIKLYKSIMEYSNGLPNKTKLYHRIYYIIYCKYNIDDCFCKCGKKLTFDNVYCRKCPELKRILIEKKLQTTYPNGTFYNKNSILILERIAMKFNVTDLQHAENGGEYRISGYAVDGYSKEKNIVFEYDERHHFRPDGSLCLADVVRQQHIENELKCRFIRIKEDGIIYVS